MQAMDPNVPAEALRDAGAFERLDMMIASDLTFKFGQLRQKSQLPVHMSHLVSKMDLMEQEAQSSTLPRLLKGREMVRCICQWVCVRSEHGQLHLS